MKLVDMKLDKKTRDTLATPSDPGDGPAYPWGLSVTLDEEALDKLGLKLPKVGKTFLLCALVDVTSVSSNEQQDQEPRSSVTLQITDLSLEDPPKGADPADTLYGKAKA